MGVSNMSAAYQRCMNEILGDAVYGHTVIKTNKGKRTEYYRPGFAKAGGLATCGSVVCLVQISRPRFLKNWPRKDFIVSEL